MTTLLNLHFPVLKYRKIILKKKTKCNQVCRSFDSPFLRKFTRIKNRIIIEYITMKCFRPFDRLNFFDKERGEKRGKIKLPIRVMMRSTQENKGMRERERESKVHCVSASTIPFRLCAAAPEQFVASVHPRGLFFSFPCQEVECFKSFVYFPPLTKRRHSKEQIHSRYTRISPSKLFLIHPWRIGLACVSFGSR